MNVVIGDSEDNSLLGSPGVDEIFGGAGADSIYGGESIDSLFGGIGDDTFFGEDGHKDIIDGGDGVDTLDLSGGPTDYATTGDFLIDIDIGLSISGGVSFIHGSYSNLENITSFDSVAIELIGNLADNTLISSKYDDTIRGEDGDDTLYGLDGVDALFGGEGNDVLHGGAGYDSLTGGNGNDTFVMSDAGGGDDLNGGNGDDTADFSAITGSNMVFNSASQTYAFSAGGPTFSLNAIEVILAGSGNDTIAGSDAYFLTINGGAGVDTLDLSSSPINVPTFGNFVLDIDEGFSVDGGSTFIYGSFSELENVTSFDKVAIELVGNNANNKLIASIYDDVIHGEDGKDKLTGHDGDDTLFGGAGKDKLYGRSGADQLFGGDLGDYLAGGGGNDILDGGDGADELVGGSGKDEIIGGSGFDHLSGDNGADQLFGGNGKDELFGGAGKDHLEGGSSDDTLAGESGKDVLKGGSGADVFVFDESYADQDSVLDFNSTFDLLQFNVGSAANEILSVTNDGTDTLIVFGATDAEVLLKDVVLLESELNFEFV